MRIHEALLTKTPLSREAWGLQAFLLPELGELDKQQEVM